MISFYCISLNYSVQKVEMIPQYYMFGLVNQLVLQFNDKDKYKSIQSLSSVGVRLLGVILPKNLLTFMVIRSNLSYNNLCKILKVYQNISLANIKKDIKAQAIKIWYI